MDDKVLLDIQQQLRKIEKIDATTSAIKEDIAELKARDVSQSQELEKAYAKAKARQDSIRDDLQHQIDNNKTLILTVSENINTLNKNIEKMMQDIVTNINEKFENFNVRLVNLETKKEKTLAKWYDRILDKAVWILILAAMAVFLKWLNVPSEIVNQLPH